MIRDQIEAKQIGQDLLDRTGEGLMTGNWDTFIACFGFPHRIDTFEGTQILQSADDMRPRFDAVRATHKADHVTDLIRHTVAVDWVDDKTIHHTHQSRPLSGSTLVLAPYTVFSIFEKQAGRWLITSSQYAICNADDLNAALHAPFAKNKEHVND